MKKNNAEKKSTDETADIQNDAECTCMDTLDDAIAREAHAADENTAAEIQAEDENERLKRLCADLTDKLQRSMADFDNFKKRTIKEKAVMYDDGICDTIEKLLPIIDNFERAVASAAPDNKNDGFYKGIALIQRQLTGYLDDIGVESAEEIGETFDPVRHFAVAHIEDSRYGAGEIVEIMQKGYTYKNKVIRCSMVKVAN